MQITASMVKELRERTGAGMMDCKKALEASGGDIDLAIEDMRKSGIAKAARKAGRIAAEGQIVIKESGSSGETVLLEINCETDFVGKDDNFSGFARALADTILEHKPADIGSLLDMVLSGSDGIKVEEARTQLVAKLGENISVRRFAVIDGEGTVGTYLHGVRIGVVVDLQGGDADLARDIAMHIAASKPVCIEESDVPAELIEKERAVFAAQAQESGKSVEIINKMVAGRVNKYLKEITLHGQPFIKDPDVTVAKLLADRKARVSSFTRYEVGEGIEKKDENFAEEVMAQAKGSSS